jgi:hypothetical protein
MVMANCLVVLVWRGAGRIGKLLDGWKTKNPAGFSGEQGSRKR